MHNSPSHGATQHLRWSKGGVVGNARVQPLVFGTDPGGIRCVMASALPIQTDAGCQGG